MKSRSFLFLLLFFFFLVAGLLAAYFSFKPTTPQEVADKIALSLSEELKSIDEEAEGILQVARDSSRVDLGEHKGCAFFVYDHQQISFWTDNAFVPTVQSVIDTFQLKLLKTGNSDYLVKKWPMEAQKFLLAVIPLYRQYSISNDYLYPEWNKKIFPSKNIHIQDINTALGIPVCVRGLCVFRITFPRKDSEGSNESRLIAIAFSIAALVMFLLFLYGLLEKIRKRYPEVVLMLLYGAFFAIRTTMTRFNFPGGLIRSDLFDPLVFASSDLNASLGDLLLNELAVLALCYYVFKNYHHFKILRLSKITILKYTLSVIAGLCLFFSTLFPFVAIQTLYNNSSIVLDISHSLRFDSIRIIAYLIVMLAGVCSFLFSHAFIRLLIADGHRNRIFISFGIAAIIFSLINEYTGQSYLSTLLTGSFYFLVVYLLELYRSLSRLTYATFAYLFVAVFCLSANSAYGVRYFSHKEKIENQFRFANNFLIDRDYFGEYLLSEASNRISSDAFIQSRLANPFLSRDAIRQKIRQLFIPSYFNKYDLEVFLFSSSGSSLDNRSGVSFSEMIKLYNQEAFKTDYSSVYVVNSPAEDVSQKYLVVVPLVRFSAISGYVVVELALKKVIPESVYPELLVDNRFRQFYKTQDYSYTVFSDKKILFSAGDFNYENFFDRNWLGKPELYTQGISEVNYDHIAQEDQNGRIAIVSTKTDSWVFIVANFSFLLVLGLTIILFFILIQGLVNYVRGTKLFFAARIQLFLNLAFFLPLMVVSITTLSLTSRSSQQQLDEGYLRKAKAFGEQMASYLDISINRYDETQVSFENQLTNLAKLSNLDANIYSAQGNLIVSSQPLIFENNLLSNFANPEAIRKIRNGETLFIDTEVVGQLEYFVAYATLKSPQSGKLIGILGIPFFQSAYSLEKVQMTILANILNIFAGFFILLLVLSWFVSGWLTFPLDFITQSLRRTSLTKVNQPLTWKADDEIGLMVKEYNQMLFKLGESKVELEQNQRERAWREMAQQVAHEIKNPLTPMKLTLQQLERSVQAGTNSPEKTEKALLSLLSQVDTLNDIASSFSSFAKMPEPVIQNIELVALLRKIISLHNQSGKIIFNTPFKELFAKGDEQLLGRVFSNVILNAFQAGKSGMPVQVEIGLEKSSSHCTLSFRDNGKGIAKEFQDLIFVPHFSTKKSGSGLGLAISKQGLEQMGGKIWFDTVVGKGTAFFIELPLGQEASLRTEG